MSIKFYLYIVILFLIIAVIFAGCGSDVVSSEEFSPYFSYVVYEVDPFTKMSFVLTLPECYDPEDSYPALLAFPPGDQSINEVEWAVYKYYIRQSIQRNWIVVSPAAVNGIKYFEGSEAYIQGLLDELQQDFNIEGNKFHLAGISNGGVSAFRVGILHPERFQSITVFPGVPLEPDFAQLNRISNLPITMYVGAFDDSELISYMDSTVTRLENLGADVNYRKWANDGHVINSLTPDHLFDLLDGYRAADTTTAMYSKSDILY